jgi:ribose transport system permease protein
VLVALVMGVLAPAFISLSGWYFMINESIFVAFIAIGMTIVLIGGGIDLSVGSVMALAGALSGSLLLHGTPMILAFAVAVAIGAAIGILNGSLIVALRLPDFIVTLAMLSAVRGILLIWTHGDPILGYVTQSYSQIGGTTKIAPYLSIPILLCFVVAVIGAVMLNKTRLGRHIHAVGGNRDAATLAGVRVGRVKILTYAISGLLAAVSGILLAGYLTEISPGTAASGYELTAIAAAVMGGASLYGGRGSVFGACLGAIALTVMTNLLQWWNVDPNLSDVLVGALILLAITLQRMSFVLAGRGRAPSRPIRRAESEETGGLEMNAK